MANIKMMTTAATAALALGGALLTPAGAQNSQAALTGIPCRVSWSETTHGGDWLTSVGDVELTQIMPQGGGRFMAIGNGQATVTYHATGPCGDNVANRTWQAPYMVTVSSDDGRTGEVDIGTSGDDTHEVVTCPGAGDFTYDVDAPEVPTTTVQLHEGSTPFSQSHSSDHGEAGDRGTVTLHYCTPDRPNGR